MSVFRIEKAKDFTVMSNYHLQDKKLSLKAKGLLSYMLSLPDDWDYSLRGLCAICLEGEKAIRNTLKELEDKGYLYREKINGIQGRFDYDYYIYERPDISPHYHKGHAVKGDTLKGTQINTNKQNTKKQIDKKDKTKSPFLNEEKHNILTNELINKGYIEKGEFQIYYYDKLFQELLEENNSYKDLFAIIHYIVPRVVSRNFKDEEGYLIENKFGYFKNAIYSNINKLNFDIDSLWDNDLNDLYSEDDFER